MHHHTVDIADAAWPRWWRMFVIALGTLILCSCRAPSHHAPPGALMPPNAMMANGSVPSLDEGAAMSGPGGVPCGPDGSPSPVNVIDRWGNPMPLPKMMLTPWRPPGIAGPWPHDEYLHDGGDRDAIATVRPDWQINGLELEDTIVHYDTLQGETKVEPSNRVCIYSPRFAAVRRVSTVHESQQKDHVVGVDLPVRVGLHNENLLATTALQPVAPIGEIGTKQASLSQLNQNPVLTEKVILLQAVQDALLPYEDFSVIRVGIFDRAEKARLAESVDAAIVWSHDKGAQVILDEQTAVIETGDKRAQATFRFDLPEHPKIRVIKCASKNMAKPGEIIDFTIRFDNVGDAVVGNVTLVDNLTTRLEYIEGTAKTSKDADFFTQINEGDSLVLRWEFKEPLKAGDGGLVRFQCKVR